jgi:hypothetical protein
MTAVRALGGYPALTACKESCECAVNEVSEIAGTNGLGQRVGFRIRRIWLGGDLAPSRTLCLVVRLRHPLDVVNGREPSMPSSRMLTFTQISTGAHVTTAFIIANSESKQVGTTMISIPHYHHHCPHLPLPHQRPPRHLQQQSRDSPLHLRQPHSPSEV